MITLSCPRILWVFALCLLLQLNLHSAIKSTPTPPISTLTTFPSAAAISTATPPPTTLGVPDFASPVFQEHGAQSSKHGAQASEHGAQESELDAQPSERHSQRVQHADPSSDNQQSDPQQDGEFDYPNDGEEGVFDEDPDDQATDEDAPSAHAHYRGLSNKTLNLQDFYDALNSADKEDEAPAETDRSTVHLSPGRSGLEKRQDLGVTAQQQMDFYRKYSQLSQLVGSSLGTKGSQGQKAKKPKSKKLQIVYIKVPLINLLEKGKTLDLSGVEESLGAGEEDYDSPGDSLVEAETATESALSQMALLAQSQLAQQPAGSAAEKLFQSLISLRQNYLENSGKNHSTPSGGASASPVPQFKFGYSVSHRMAPSAIRSSWTPLGQGQQEESGSEASQNSNLGNQEASFGQQENQVNYGQNQNRQNQQNYPRQQLQESSSAQSQNSKSQSSNGNSKFSYNQHNHPNNQHQQQQSHQPLPSPQAQTQTQTQTKPSHPRYPIQHSQSGSESQTHQSASQPSQTSSPSSKGKPPYLTTIPEVFSPPQPPPKNTTFKFWNSQWSSPNWNASSSSSFSGNYKNSTETSFASQPNRHPPRNHIYQPAIHGALTLTGNDTLAAGSNRHKTVSILPIVIQIDSKALREEKEREAAQKQAQGSGTGAGGGPRPSGFTESHFLPVNQYGGLNLASILQQLEAHNANHHQNVPYAMSGSQNYRNFNFNRSPQHQNNQNLLNQAQQPNYHGSASSWAPASSSSSLDQRPGLQSLFPKRNQARKCCRKSPNSHRNRVNSFNSDNRWNVSNYVSRDRNLGAFSSSIPVISFDGPPFTGQAIPGFEADAHGASAQPMELLSRPFIRYPKSIKFWNPAQDLEKPKSAHSLNSKNKDYLHSQAASSASGTFMKHPIFDDNKELNPVDHGSFGQRLPKSYQNHKEAGTAQANGAKLSGQLDPIDFDDVFFHKMPSFSDRQHAAALFKSQNNAHRPFKSQFHRTISQNRRQNNGKNRQQPSDSLMASASSYVTGGVHWATPARPSPPPPTLSFPPTFFYGGPSADFITAVAMASDIRSSHSPEALHNAMYGAASVPFATYLPAPSQITEIYTEAPVNGKLSPKEAKDAKKGTKTKASSRFRLLQAAIQKITSRKDKSTKASTAKSSGAKS